MVDPEFSEFQYAYGLTSELDASHGPIRLLKAPFFPTQPEEAHVPADVSGRLADDRVGIAPLFLQYKRSERLTTAGANEWDHYGREYYRFYIYPRDRSHQHNRLVELASRMPLTYYVAPGFVDLSEYQRLAERNELGENSIFIDCGSLSRINDERKHAMTYTLSPRQTLMLSEPEEGRSIKGFISLLDELSERVEFESLGSLQDRLENLRRVLFEDISDWTGDDNQTPFGWLGRQQQLFFDRMGTSLLFVYDGTDLD